MAPLDDRILNDIIPRRQLRDRFERGGGDLRSAQESVPSECFYLGVSPWRRHIQASLTLFMVPKYPPE